MAPVTNWASKTPNSVSTGMSALRRPCFSTTIHSAKPLRRASLTNSLSRTSSTLSYLILQVKPVISMPDAKKSPEAEGQHEQEIHRPSYGARTHAARCIDTQGHSGGRAD